MRHLVASAVIAGATICLVAPQTLGSCESFLTIRSSILDFQVYETTPDAAPDDDFGDTSLSAILSASWDNLACGLATAVATQRLLERDQRLASRFVDAGIFIQRLSGRGGPTYDISARDSSFVDSTRVLLVRAEGDSAAWLYTVFLKSFEQGAVPEKFSSGMFVPSEGDEDEPRDTTVVLDIVYNDCTSYGRRPRLFTLPPSQTKDKRVWLLSGLYYSIDDAKRAMSPLATKWGLKGEVIKIQATGPVLQCAFPAAPEGE